MIVVWLAHLFSFQKIHTFIGLSVITMQLLGIPHARVRKNLILEKWRFPGPILLENVWVRIVFFINFFHRYQVPF